MKLTCPICQSKYSLEELATTSAMREMIGLAAKFGPTWDLVEEYVTTFRTSRYGGITLTKRLRLLREAARLWEGCEFVYSGKRYRTGHSQIREALNVVCNADKFGFRNHNYLKKVLLDGADRVSAEGMTAAEEREREDNRRLDVGNGRDRSVLRREERAGEEDESMTTAEYKTKLGKLADQIGGTMKGQVV